MGVVIENAVIENEDHPDAWHDAAMTAVRASSDDALHRIPRHPYAWVWPLLLSQALVAIVWRYCGWRMGLSLMAVSHAPFWWATLWPRSQWLSPALCRLPTRAQAVWLTIDDGPSDDTLAILDLLDAHTAKATFFLVGERAQQQPQLVREIMHRGHCIGNHSYSHPSRWFWALGPARMRREIEHTQRILRDITGLTPQWFRAVVGMSNPFVAAVLKDNALSRVAWCARGFDGVVADPAKIITRIERGIAPGAIVLLHEGAAHGRNVETIGLLLRRLDTLGYQAVLPN